MQREYGLDLRTMLPTMTWRRFMVLIRGLSPNSAVVAHMRASQFIGKRQQNVVEIKTPEAAQRAFVALFAPPNLEGQA